MAIFKLKKDELFQTWYRDYYEIEAETLEEAKQMILNYEEEPYDSEQLFGSFPKKFINLCIR